MLHINDDILDVVIYVTIDYVYNTIYIYISVSAVSISIMNMTCMNKSKDICL